MFQIVSRLIRAIPVGPERLVDLANRYQTSFSVRRFAVGSLVELK
jgi:hypothetical protein